ncbi:hypothetical protein F4678DRAFT_434327 [Xylaria arbuscula]|nr:hypothetical protein F4678DRAFT_434327 [Xylaria arbuscula]
MLAARQPAKQNTLGDLDSMFSGISNLLNFGRVSIWLKQPLLFLVALVSWLLPIAFVLPPGTLSVVVMTDHFSTMQTVPNVDFTSFNYASDLKGYALVLENGDSYSFRYNAPSIEVEKIAFAVAAQGNILPITPPAENASWSLRFYGPSLSCGPMNVSVQTQVESNIATWLWADLGNSNVTGDTIGLFCRSNPAIYLCWHPTSYYTDTPQATGTTVLPYINNNTQFDDDLDFHLTSDYEFFKGDPTGPFTPFYMALLPGIAENPCQPTDYDYRLPFTHIDNATFFQCDLHNASYYLEFNFQSGVQSITRSIERLNAVATVSEVLGPDSDGNNNSTCIQKNGKTSPGSCIFDTTALQRLSYTAILDAFTQTMSGSVSGSKFTNHPASDSNIISTTLTNTMQLQYLVEASKVRNSTLERIFEKYNNPNGRGISNWANWVKPAPQPSLPRPIEEIFNNFTISLMSSDALQPNPESIYCPPPVNVTFTVLKPVYSYAPPKLWISYGAAIVATSLALALGSIGLRANGDFSTILRATYGAVLSVSMKREDAQATAPLPTYLEHARVDWLSLDNSSVTPRSETNAEDEHPEGENVGDYRRESRSLNGYRSVEPVEENAELPATVLRSYCWARDNHAEFVIGRSDGNFASDPNPNQFRSDWPNLDQIRIGSLSKSVGSDSDK